ncbi:iron chelate uptake ABC transporter family permease subunit [Humitalea sp. 24SJ18S-53]|uniref:iron chelate uptake ABC transporter family permease subunit n=1 Tax=Humitalea sp. 24SJ18S-53 TaxID=3422307 RepID=UPI003D668483
MAGVIAAQADWARLAARRSLVLESGAGLLVLCLVVDVATGPAMLAPATVAAPLSGLSRDPMVDAIVWAIRLPVALMALLVGAALGLTGAVMQTILNNRLASSYTLGVSAGAGFGAALVIVFGAALPLAEAQAVPLAAFASAALACAGVWLLGGTGLAGHDLGAGTDSGALPRHSEPGGDVDAGRRMWRCTALAVSPFTLAQGTGLGGAPLPPDRW